MQKTDCYRLDAERVESAPQRLDGGWIDGDEHLARCARPFTYLEGEIARHQRARPVEVKIECVRSVAPPQRIDVAKTLRGDERSQSAATLQHAVDRAGRGVQHFAARSPFASRN